MTVHVIHSTNESGIDMMSNVCAPRVALRFSAILQCQGADLIGNVQALGAVSRLVFLSHRQPDPQCCCPISIRLRADATAFVINVRPSAMAHVYPHRLGPKSEPLRTYARAQVGPQKVHSGVSAAGVFEHRMMI